MTKVNQTNNYSYPIDPSWSNEELNTVINMFRVVEDAYETGTTKEAILNQYRKFKEFVNSKAFEKQLGKEFENVSGYSLYRVVQKAKNSATDKVRMKDND